MPRLIFRDNNFSLPRLFADRYADVFLTFEGEGRGGGKAVENRTCRILTLFYLKRRIAFHRLPLRHLSSLESWTLRFELLQSFLYLVTFSREIRLV